MDRREYLTILGVFGAATIAGCSEENDDPQVESSDDESNNDESDSGNGSEDGQDSQNENQDSEGESDDSGEEDDDSGEDDTTFELGETAIFTQENQEIEFRAHNARLTNALVSSISNSLVSDLPESDLFLLIDATIENVGSETASVPRTVNLVVDGTQYEQSFVGSASLDNPYSNFTELRSGAEQTGTLVFSVPDTDAAARLFVEWGSLETVTGEWEFNLEDIDREIFDYSGNGIGEPIEFGTEEIRYQLSVQNIELSRSYTYEGFGGTQEEQASSGQQWAIANISAQNTGERTVSVPGTFSMRLIADGQQYQSSVYLGDNGYTGENLSSGSTTEGVVVFEIPDTVSQVRLEVELTQGLIAEWILD